MSTAQTFADWAGQQVPYRFTQRPSQTRPGTVTIVCEIDPHNTGEFTAMGSGRTEAEALDMARADWNDYDREDAAATGSASHG